MSQYYESQGRKSSACDFGGNAKLNSNALTKSASSVAESCIANPNSTFVPGSPSSAAGGGKPTSTGGGGGNNGGSISLMDSIQNLGLVIGLGAFGALWTLLA